MSSTNAATAPPSNRHHHVVVDARVLAFLIQRVQYLNRQVVQQQQQQQQLDAKEDEENDDENDTLPPPDLCRRIARASQCVAKSLIQPPEIRKDLKLHATARAIISKIKRNDVQGACDILTQTPELVEMKHSDNGFTLLHIAAKEGMGDICAMLMNTFDMDPWDVDLLGRTALHVAADGLHEDACKILKDHMGECVGENAPRDAGGITPAAATAKSAMTNPTTRNNLAKLLHRVGDFCISPLPITPKSREVNRRGGGGHHIVPPPPPPPSWFGSFTMPGWRVTMEDFICQFSVSNHHNTNIQVFGLFDGHGGSGAAYECSKEASRCFKDVISSQPNIITKNVVSQGILNMEHYLRQLPAFTMREVEKSAGFGGDAATVRSESQDKSGTTVVMALLTPTHVYVSHVGDSRAVIFRRQQQEGWKATLSTRDHRAIAHQGESSDDPFYASERDRIEVAGGIVEENGYVSVRNREGFKIGMTRTLGNFEAKSNPNLPDEAQILVATPETVCIERTSPLSHKEILIMCSDGIWDVMTSLDVAMFLNSNENLTQYYNLPTTSSALLLNNVAKDLCLEAFARGTMDNMSVWVVDINTTTTTTSITSLDQQELRPRKLVNEL